MSRRHLLCSTAIPALLLGWAVFLAPGSASPCSAPRCLPLQPVDGTTFPANHVRFLVDPEHRGRMVIEDSQGSPVPASIKKIGDDLFFGPDQTLPVGGTYTFRFDPHCVNDPPPPPGTPSEGSVRFTTAAPSDLPRTLGRLVIDDRATTHYRASMPGNRTLAVVLEPSEEMKAFLPLARWRPTIEGRSWVLSPAGGGPYGPFVPDQLGRTTTFASVVLMSCSPRSDWSLSYCGYFAGAPPGAHRMVLVADLLGVESDPPPLEVALTADCSGVPPVDAGPPDGPPPDGHPGPPDATGERDAPPSPAPSPPATTPTASRSGGSGCALAPRGRSTGLAPLAALAGIAALLHVQRRRRSSPS